MQRLRDFATRPRRGPLPALASELGALVPEAMGAARRVWARRCSNERASVALARRLQDHARAADLGDLRGPWLDAFARLEEDEVGHVALTAEVLRALDVDPDAAPAVRLREPVGTPLDALAHDVCVGLFLCEAVSASRLASVWGATDLPAVRARVGALLRDEVAHAQLGATLLAPTLRLLAAPLGEAAARDRMRRAVDDAVAELVGVVAGGMRPEELPRLRPQPRGNPGVVEPAVDAHALYRALSRTVRPAMARL